MRIDYFTKERKKISENTISTKIVISLSLCLVLVISLINDAIGQGQDQGQRPKIGLVLSGGGAKGIAHIGILKTLEEIGLTPDYITGTSMGSIVGGLYSIGYSADELEELVTTIDWDEILTNKIPMDKVAFEEKQYYGRYLLNFYIRDKKFELPKGLIDGQALMELFSRLTRPVHGISDFDNFPIPFRCVATNIVTGLPVTLESGSLAAAMRASMAIPSIFTPVVIDNQLLVDGGLVRNFPVQEAIEMGADIIIGVFVSSDLAPESELNSAFSILSQSAWVTSAFDTREQMKLCDILIEPNLEGYSTASFSSASGILERGKEAGREYYELLKNLADSVRALGDLHTIDKMEVKKSYHITKIELEGIDNTKDEYILGKLRLNPQENISVEDIEERINVLFGTQYFEKIWYEFLSMETDTNQYLLKLHIQERPRTELKFSYHYDTETKGGILGNITLRNMLFRGSRFVFEADLSTNPFFWADYFKYMGKGENEAFRLSGLWETNDLPLYDSLGNNTDIFESRQLFGTAGIQSTRTQNNTFGANIRMSNNSLKPKVASEFLRIINKIVYKSASVNLFYKRNNLNHRYYPTRGAVVDVSYKYVFYSDALVDVADSVIIGPGDLDFHTDNIHSLYTEYRQLIPASKKLTFITELAMNLSTLEGTSLNLTEYYFIGGFYPRYLNTYHYYGGSPKEFQLSNFFYSSASIQYEILKNLFLRGSFNYLDSEYPMKLINTDLEASLMGDRYRRFGYAFLAGFNSPLGPINLAFGKDHYRKGWDVFFAIGFIF